MVLADILQRRASPRVCVKQKIDVPVQYNCDHVEAGFSPPTGVVQHRASIIVHYVQIATIIHYEVHYVKIGSAAGHVDYGL